MDSLIIPISTGIVLILVAVLIELERRKRLSSTEEAIEPEEIIDVESEPEIVKEEIFELPFEPVSDMTTQNITINPKGDPTKVAILFGINVCDPFVYQGDTLRLQGCVNDSLHVRTYLMRQKYGKIYLFTDKQATIGNFLKVWGEVSSTLKDGDTLLLQMSRHGMSLGENVLDTLGDTEISKGEFSGDQAAVMHDGLIIDDCFWRLFSMLPKVKLIFLNDSCHSATQYKLANLILPGKESKYIARRAVSNSYIPIKDKIVDLRQLEKLFPKPNTEVPKCTLVSLSGCQDHEFSADAYISRKYQGAFTFALLTAILAKPNSTPRELSTSVKAILAQRGFNQNPQVNIEGDQTFWDKPLLT